MKKLIPLIAFAAFVSCGEKKQQEPAETVMADPMELGRELFEGKGNCFACHKPDQKIIGPSIKEIAGIYKSQGADMTAFLRGEAEPIVDPSQYEIMKTNLPITKAMTDQELRALEIYMYSFLNR